MAIQNKSVISDNIADLEKELAGLADQSQEIVDEFSNRLQELRQARKILIEDILKRQDEEKIRAILRQIK